MSTRHFLNLSDLTQTELRTLLERAAALKAMHYRGELYQPLVGKVLGMIFEKSSTRTRVSFEAGMAQLGGHALFLSSRDTQLGRGEPIEDTARVLSHMVDVIMIRTFAHETVERFAEHSRVPVINGLTDMYHPCQLLADMQTYYEKRGSIQGKKVAWIGDGYNMCHTYMVAAQLFDFKLVVATPQGYEPNQALLSAHSNHVEVTDDPAAAASQADLITTDVWASMGQEEEQEKRKQLFEPYQVNSLLMSLAKPDVVFMHCLPAHREEEVTTEVIDGTQSIVWDQAENRLHAQKALLEFLLVTQ